jgi:hypothetical protein
MTGERQEDIVERGAAQHDVGHLDALGVEQPHRIDEHGRAARDGHQHARVLDDRVCGADGPQHLRGPPGPGRVETEISMRSPPIWSFSTPPCRGRSRDRDR